MFQTSAPAAPILTHSLNRVVRESCKWRTACTKQYKDWSICHKMWMHRSAPPKTFLTQVLRKNNLELFMITIKRTNIICIITRVCQTNCYQSIMSPISIHFLSFRVWYLKNLHFLHSGPICLGWVAFLWCKMPMFSRAGMRDSVTVVIIKAWIQITRQNWNTFF